MQVEAEELAKRVANEPDNRSRIKKVYQYVYGRDASEEEIVLGLEYLKSEPLLEYEEQKAKPAAGAAGARRGGRGGPAQGQGKPAAPPVTKNESEPPASGSGSNPADVAAAPPLPPPSSKLPEGVAKPAPPMPDAGEAVAVEGDAAAAAAAEPMGMGMGMMGGMGGRRGAGGGAPEVKYDVTVWGRYAKVLFSSSEFLFIN
jgi:hypothetical protein